MKGDRKTMEPVRKHWCWKSLERKRGNAETLDLFIAFIVFNVFHGLHCLSYPLLPSMSFCAFCILQCPSMQKAELWALRDCYICKYFTLYWIIGKSQLVKKLNSDVSDGSSSGSVTPLPFLQKSFSQTNWIFLTIVDLFSTLLLFWELKLFLRLRIKKQNWRDLD